MNLGYIRLWVTGFVFVILFPGCRIDHANNNENDDSRDATRDTFAGIDVASNDGNSEIDSSGGDSSYAFPDRSSDYGPSGRFVRIFVNRTKAPYSECDLTDLEDSFKLKAGYGLVGCNNCLYYQTS